MKIIERIDKPARRAPRCEGIVADQTQRWRERIGETYQCARPARYLFQSKPFCTLHAGEAAVAYLLGQIYAD